MRKVLIPTDLWGGKYCVFGEYEDLVFSVGKTGSRRIISVFAELNVGMAPSAKEREKRDSLLCDGDTVDAVLGSVFD